MGSAARRVSLLPCRSLVARMSAVYTWQLYSPCCASCSRALQAPAWCAHAASLARRVPRHEVRGLRNRPRGRPRAEAAARRRPYLWPKHIHGARPVRGRHRAGQVTPPTASRARGGGLSARFENVLAVDGAGSALRARNSGTARRQYRNQRRLSTAHQWAAGSGKFGLSLSRVARPPRKGWAGERFLPCSFFWRDGEGRGWPHRPGCGRLTTSQSIVHGARASVSPLANAWASFPPWEPSMRGTWSVRARHPQRVAKKHAGSSSRLWAVWQPSCQRLTALTYSSHRVRACL